MLRDPTVYEKGFLLILLLSLLLYTLYNINNHLSRMEQEPKMSVFVVQVQGVPLVTCNSNAAINNHVMLHVLVSFLADKKAVLCNASKSTSVAAATL